MKTIGASQPRLSLVYQDGKNSQNPQPKIEHFGCLIDLLSKAGLVDQAEEFVKTIAPGERLHSIQNPT